MKVLFVASDIHLLDQASAKLNDWQVNHGIIQADRNTNPSAKVQVMSIQTIMSQNIPFQPDLIVVDEAHNAGSDSYQVLFNTCPNAKRLLISATPKREDGRGFDHIASKMIEGVTAQELINLGCLIKLIFPIIREQGVVANYKIHCRGKKALVFAKDKVHAQKLTTEFNDAGISARCVTDKTPQEERERIFQSFENGDLSVLVNVNICAEGYNYPALEVVILSTKINSLGRYLQCIGRVTRPSPATGKEFGIVLDIGNSRALHGDMTDTRNWSLAGKPILRIQDILDRQKEMGEDKLESGKREYWRIYNSQNAQLPPYIKQKETRKSLNRQGWPDLDICAFLWKDNNSKIIKAIEEDYQIQYLDDDPRTQRRLRVLESSKVKEQSFKTPKTPEPPPAIKPKVRIAGFKEIVGNPLVKGYADVSYGPSFNITHSNQLVIAKGDGVHVFLNYPPRSKIHSTEAYEQAATEALIAHLRDKSEGR